MPDAQDSKRGGPLYEYLVASSVRPHAQLEELQQVTLQHPRKGMLSPPDSIAILQMLAKLTSAKNIIEVGVFTGYTTLGMALALPADGRLIACDVSTEYTSIGQPYWEAAGVADRIDLRIAPATETLNALLEHGREGTFDMAFIDADKNNYSQYYELLLKLLRPGGIIAVDNVLWSGKVIDESVQDEDTVGIRAINKKIYEDERVDVAMLTNSDGITIARKR